jgi:hypothetical protein
MMFSLKDELRRIERQIESISVKNVMERGRKKSVAFK